jgi:hypothetical protein
MRPRDILNRTKRTYFIIVAVSFATLAIIAFLDKYVPQALYNIVALGAGTVFMVGVLLVYFGIKCPKCNATLGLKYVYAEETLRNCPRCGINFDEDSS